jgi:hypothetical protein
MAEAMPVRCPECGYDNRDNYRFCGMCGASLRPAAAQQRKAGLREQATVVTEPPPLPRNAVPRAAPLQEEAPPVSGPSFLGLADAPARNDVQYLLEDEDSHSGGRRMLIAFLLLVVAGGLVYWHWSRDGFPWSAGSSHQAQAPVFSGASSAPSPAEPLPPPVSDTPRSATPPVVPSSDEAHMTKSDDAPAAPKENENAVPANTAPDQTGESLAAAVPDSAPSKPSMAPSESASSPAASDTETTPDPAKPTPAKPVRSAITKPAPAPAPVSGDDQLVADGEKYLYGNGVPANCDRAQKNLRAAAGHGSSRALSMLGTMYATGHCADRDLPNAYRSFAKALHLDPNNSRIQSDLEILWRQMTPDERQAATHSN